MKKVKTLLIAIAGLLTISLVSCSSSYEPKAIEATSEEFTSGELAKYVSVGSPNGELTYFEKEGTIETQYIRLKVKLEMQRDGFKNVDARDINFTKLLSVAVINLVDKDGVETQDLSIKSEELLKLKKLLTGDKGDCKDIIFEGKFHNSEDAPKWFDKTTNFTPYLTGDIMINSYSNHGVTMTTYDDDNDVYADDDNDVYAGDDDDDVSYSNSSSNSEDWDSILDSYDSYVTKYISYIRKASHGDMNALSEYPTLMNKAQEFSEKMQNAQGEMSSSQWARYIKITNKLSQAATDLR